MNVSHETREHYENLLKFWADYAQNQNKLLESLVYNISNVSDVTEDKTLELSTQFQQLASGAKLQSDYLTGLIETAGKVEVDGQGVPIDDISSQIKTTFLASIEMLLNMSKQATVMVYALDEAVKSLNNVEKCIKRIEGINQKMKYLAVNATIEAVRAGEVGESFQVVANEVRELSDDTQKFASDIYKYVKEMVLTINQAQHDLHKTAHLDLSTSMLKREKLDAIMQGLMRNSEQMSHMIGEAVGSSSEITTTASTMIRGLQYQDRVKQDLQFVQKTLNQLLQHNQELSQATSKMLQGENIPQEDFERLRKNNQILTSPVHSISLAGQHCDNASDVGEVTLF